MKNFSNKRIVVALAISISLIVILGSLVPFARSETLGSWTATTSYPTNILGNSCVTSSGYVFCIGGNNGTAPVSDFTYYASLSSSGVGSWTKSASYPLDVYLTSCATAAGYVYCVGGTIGGGTLTSAVYSATVSSSGIGSWTLASTFPTDLEASSCNISNGYIYCVGGLTYVASSPFANTNATYYASVSTGIVGTWSTSAEYPLSINSNTCTTTSGYIYCVGGQYNPNVSGDLTNSTYYASISSAGIGTWNAGTQYPRIIDSTSCVNSGGYIYCVAGFETDLSYYAPISSSSIGLWTSTSTYPTYVEAEPCVISGSYLYCIGGYTSISEVYYSQIESATTSTTTTMSSTTSITTSSSTASSTTMTSTSSSTVTSTSTISSTSSSSSSSSSTSSTASPISTSSSSSSSTSSSQTSTTSSLASTQTTSTTTSSTKSGGVGISTFTYELIIAVVIIVIIVAASYLVFRRRR